MFCGNDKVLDGMTISLLSITKYTKEPLNVYIGTADLTEYNSAFTPVSKDQAMRLEELIKKTNTESRVHLLDMTSFKEELLTSANVDTGYSPYTHLRLFIDEYDLPEKLLYLDVDIAAFDDISKLYNIDISNYEVAAVRDYYGKIFFHPNYVNAGVLLLNTKLIKQTGLMMRCRKLVHDKKLFLSDQNALNKEVKHKLILPAKFNSQKKLTKDTVISHFCKTIKFFPWFHTLNIKPWQIDRLHSKYKCFELDDVLGNYVRVKDWVATGKESAAQDIPVFFASDKNYLPYLSVAIKSLVDNAKSNNNYKVYVLSHDLTDDDFVILKQFEKENIEISRVDVKEKIASIKDKLGLRDYYTVSIYFRLFIPSLFPQYDRAIYLDSDIIIKDDVAKLFDVKIGENYVAAVLDKVVRNSKDFIYYVNNALDITEDEYFNSGVLVMNLDKFRKDDIENDFYNWVLSYNFGAVAPDQDYLNCICKGKVVYIDAGWNEMPLGERMKDEEIHLIHFNMFMKPWKYDDTMYGEYFWEYAQKTPFYQEIIDRKGAVTPDNKINDIEGCNKLMKIALQIADSDNNYKKVVLKK